VRRTERELYPQYIRYPVKSCFQSHDSHLRAKEFEFFLVHLDDSSFGAIASPVARLGCHLSTTVKGIDDEGVALLTIA